LTFLFDSYAGYFLPSVMDMQKIWSAPKLDVVDVWSVTRFSIYGGSGDSTYPSTVS